MSITRVERAIALVSQIEVARAELARLEGEFEELLTPKTTRKNARGKAGPSRNKVKILRIIQKAGSPVSPKDIGKKLHLTNATVNWHIRGLLAQKVIIRTGRALYAKA
jgi:biotin operon repressor